MSSPLKPFSWERMIEAVERVRERTLRAARALEASGVPYAIAGGTAVAAWVARVDATAVRNTRDVDILVRRRDFDRIRQSLESVGFHYQESGPLRKTNGRPPSGTDSSLSPRAAGERGRVRGGSERTLTAVDCFLDGPDGSPRDAVHLLYAGEKVRPEYVSPSADVSDATPADEYMVVDLEPLVRMKLNSFRDKDRTHLRDFIELGIIDATWGEKLSPELATRLQQLLEDPYG